MKKSVGTLFSLFLLSAFTSCVSSQQLIHDTNGELVENGGIYEILQANPGEDEVGGISLASTGNDACPLTVVQSSLGAHLPPLPVRISSPATIPVLADGLPMEFSFIEHPSCVPMKNFWTLVESAVKVDKVKNVSFNIREVRKATYKIMSQGKDIGLKFYDDGVASLVVTDDKPLEVVFKKVNYLSSPSASA